MTITRDVIRITEALMEIAEEMTQDEGHGPREMIAALCLAFVRANFVNARDGKETAALEDSFRFMRAAHDDLMKAYLADREAPEAVH